jgi:DNA-binding LacI/PurR family transcriptional regulator
VNRKPTIKDVANAVGCGVATASRALNGSGPVSPATLKKVQGAAAELGFTFNALGRALRNSQTLTIGCIVPSLANPVFADAVQGIQQELHVSGYQLLLTCSNYSAAQDDLAIRMLLDKQVDAIIMTLADPAKLTALAGIKRRDLPVQLLFNTPLPGIASTHVDNKGAAHSVAAEFAQAGHRATAFLALEFRSSDRSRQRFDGFCEGCAAHGMQVPVLLEIDEGIGQLAARLRALLVQSPEITGIFASNDFLAIALMQAARAIGLQVPRDLSIVGFDGIEIGQLLDPTLATVETNPQGMGRSAARHILQALAHHPATAQPPLPFRFRPGGSLAPVGRADKVLPISQRF